jgi:hypothetical protein
MFVYLGPNQRRETGHAARLPKLGRNSLHEHSYVTVYLRLSIPLYSLSSLWQIDNMGLVSGIANFFSSIYIFLWDTVLAFGNLVLPKRPTALVVPDGHPGSGGKWPEYVPAKEGDSRCSCPGINALANHGEPP